MPTVGQFKDELRATLKRGDSLDDRLGSYMRRAAQWIEQNYTLQYMRRRVTLEVAAGTDSIPVPARMKTIESLKWRDVYSEYSFCHKRSFELIERVPYDGTIPSQFYLDGMETIVFNGTPQGELVGDGIAALYSNFPMVDGASHWLLDNAEELMLVQCMITASVVNRDERTWTMFKTQREEQIKVLQNADYEAVYTGQDLNL